VCNKYKFRLKLSSRKWEYPATYYFTREEDGWEFQDAKLKAKVDKGGSPLFYQVLISESISYPRDLEDYISTIWNKASLLTTKETQELFNILSEWISKTERNKPFREFL
jgi:hypothetical protein